MSESLRRRIAALEQGLPREIVLTLADGGTFHHSGPAMRFFDEGMRQVLAGKGAIAEAVAQTVRAQGCGLLWQMLAALMQPKADGREATLTGKQVEHRKRRN